MGRLIDADAIPWFVEGIGDIPVVTKEEIDAMQTVDTVPVVRCKDCRFNYGIANGESFNPQDILCTYFDTDGLTAEDYCSMAERIEE